MEILGLNMKRYARVLLHAIRQFPELWSFTCYCFQVLDGELSKTCEFACSNGEMAIRGNNALSCKRNFTYDKLRCAGRGAVFRASTFGRGASENFRCNLPQLFERDDVGADGQLQRHAAVVAAGV
jgi:hypothetical protein